MQISLRAGERIYINGAVVRADRKVTLELLNNVTFLLESHVLQPEDTTTPLRQLYFVVQTMLMEPREAEAARALFAKLHPATEAAFGCETIRAGLRDIALLVDAGRAFEALRALRALYAAEQAILVRAELSPSMAA